METRLSKRNRAAKTFIHDKVQDLPLLCVEAICKFTPTSQLVRLHANAVPLPGAFWNFGLEAVLKKRYPFSLSEDRYGNSHGAARVDALFDSSGAKIAAFKHPEAFRFSPLCEFVQSATVHFGAIPSFAVAEPRLRYAISGPPLLPHLPNVSKIALDDLGNFEHRNDYASKTLDRGDFLIPALRKILPQLDSFAFPMRWPQRQVLETALFDMLPEMTSLKHLQMPELTFGALMRAATSGPEKSEALRRVLSRLSSLRIGKCYYYGVPSIALRIVNFTSGCCAQLTHLLIVVCGEFKPYLIALRALVSLGALGLDVVHISFKGVTFSEDETVESVLKLRLSISWSFEACNDAVAVASLFPNVKVAVLPSGAVAAKICAKGVWPKLDKVTCLFDCFPQHIAPLTRFLAEPNLPSVVDLSPDRGGDLLCGPNALTDIYQAMQGGAIKTLLLRGPMHREALPRLQAHVDLIGESVKITAWKDRDLGDQSSVMRFRDVIVPASEFSQQTDIRISGAKENRGEFTIRVFHQHKTDIFLD